MKNKKYLSLLMGAVAIQAIMFCSAALAEGNNTDNNVKFTIHNDSGFTLEPGRRKYHFISYPYYNKDIPSLDNLPAQFANGSTADFDIDISSISRDSKSHQYNDLVITYYYKPDPADEYTWAGCEFTIIFSEGTPTGYYLFASSVDKPGLICTADDTHHELHIKNKNAT